MTVITVVLWVLMKCNLLSEAGHIFMIILYHDKPVYFHLFHLCTYPVFFDADIIRQIKF